jgi:hypothetical protein
MTDETQLTLQAIALLHACARGDVEAAQLLAVEGGGDLSARIAGLCLSIIESNTSGNTLAYLEWLTSQVLQHQGS